MRKVDPSTFEIGRPITDRWITYAEWKNESSNPIAFFKTTWVVPPEPETKGIQVVLLFNGLENNNRSHILQPVLQWGRTAAGGGNFWAISNWYAGNITVVKRCQRVAPGQKIQGIMKLERILNNQFSYSSSFVGFPVVDLDITNVDELNFATEVLECKLFNRFTDYPNTDSTSMMDIEIRVSKASLLEQVQAPLDWSPHNIVTDNGQRCEIVKNGTPNGKVEIFYRQTL